MYTRFFNHKKGFLQGGLFYFSVLGLWVSGIGCTQQSASPNKTNTNGVLVTSIDTTMRTKETLPVSNTDTLPQKPDTVSIIGVGDIMLGTNYPSTKYLPAQDGKNLLSDVQPILLNADITFGNLEGTLFDKGGTPKTCSDSSICYTFRTPAAYVQHFLNAGFDFLSIANNHSGDFGFEGRRLTKKTLQEAGIAYAGLAGTDETAIVERNGVRYGLCAFAPNSGTCSIKNIPAAKALVTKLAAETDIVIVSFHGGAEGPTHQHVPKKIEEYLGENRGNVYAFSHAVIDAGADIVFGHGPHITRAIELYNDRFIAYSLGNFCTYGRFNLTGPAGVAPIVKVFTRADGTFLHGQITPIFQQKTHGPKIDSRREATSIIQQLTAADFPETPLVISENGVITKK